MSAQCFDALIYLIGELVKEANDLSLVFDGIASSLGSITDGDFLSPVVRVLRRTRWAVDGESARTHGNSTVSRQTDASVRMVAENEWFFWSQA